MVFVRLLSVCCSIDVRLMFDKISRNRRVRNGGKACFKRTRIGGASMLLRTKSGTPAYLVLRFRRKSINPIHLTFGCLFEHGLP